MPVHTHLHCNANTDEMKSRAEQSSGGGWGTGDGGSRGRRLGSRGAPRQSYGEAGDAESRRRLSRRVRRAPCSGGGYSPHDRADRPPPGRGRCDASLARAGAQERKRRAVATCRVRDYRTGSVGSVMKGLEGRRGRGRMGHEQPRRTWRACLEGCGGRAWRPSVDVRRIGQPAKEHCR